MHNKHEPSLEEVLGNLRTLLEAEREVAEESRVIEAKIDRSQAGQGELRQQLGRLEILLADVLAGQAELRRRLDAIEDRRSEAARLEDLVLRLVARLPLAGLGAEAAAGTVN